MIRRGTPRGLVLQTENAATVAAVTVSTHVVITAERVLMTSSAMGRTSAHVRAHPGSSNGS
jgi:hypothetical protein